MVDDLAGLLICWFGENLIKPTNRDAMLTLAVGSPCLSTGAAGFSDMFTFLKLPYCLAFWACSGEFELDNSHLQEAYCVKLWNIQLRRPIPLGLRSYEEQAFIDVP